jgi:streptogramin lyase
MRRLVLVALLALAACDPAPTRTGAPGPQKPSTSAPTGPRVVDTVEGTKAFGDPAALAFDTAGRLYVGNYESGTIARYLPADLERSGVPAASAVVEKPEVKGPNAMVFDAHGYLWVPMYDAGTVVGFTPDDLLAARAPSIVLRPGGDVLVQPAGVALDADGNLWVSNSGVGHLVRFPRRGGLEAGTAKPDVVLDVVDAECQGVAVVDGRLWHACADSDEIYVYDLKAVKSGRPKPSAVLKWPLGRQCGPVQLTSAPDGGLAAACYNDAAVVVFRAVARNGNVVETSRISAPELTNVHGIAFDSSGALWAGTNLNVLARFPAGATDPDVVLRPR